MSDKRGGIKLTDSESDVISGLAGAWDLFLKLPVAHNDDVTEFRAAIHQAQNIVLSRPASRYLNYKEVDRDNDNG